MDAWKTDPMQVNLLNISKWSDFTLLHEARWNLLIDETANQQEADI